MGRTVKPRLAVGRIAAEAAPVMPDPPVLSSVEGIRHPGDTADAPIAPNKPNFSPKLHLSP